MVKKSEQVERKGTVLIVIILLVLILAYLSEISEKLSKIIDLSENGPKPQEPQG